MWAEPVSFCLFKFNTAIMRHPLFFTKNLCTPLPVQVQLVLNSNGTATSVKLCLSSCEVEKCQWCFQLSSMSTHLRLLLLLQPGCSVFVKVLHPFSTVLSLQEVICPLLRRLSQSPLPNQAQLLMTGGKSWRPLSRSAGRKNCDISLCVITENPLILSM